MAGLTPNRFASSGRPAARLSSYVRPVLDLTAVIDICGW